MNTYLLNPTLKSHAKYIREGRCMQKAASWATAWPPITLARLGALARRKGPVRLLDGNVERVGPDDLLADIAAHRPDLVVVNTGFPSIDTDMAVARQIREAFPEVKLVAFGAYFALVEAAEAMAPYPFLDFALLGEPEETFEELLDAVSGGAGGFGDISGLAVRTPDGVRVNPPRPPIDELDRLPFPDRDLLHNDRYRLPHNGRPYTLVNTARGCPFRCSFCIVEALCGPRVRRHSIEYILDEVAECVQKHRIREFLFWEETFTLDRQFVLSFCEALRRRGLAIRWAATTRVTAIDEELLAAMKQAGCYLLGMGIESSSQEILDRAGKKQTAADVTRAVALCRKAGIRTMGHCIFGLPGETRETAAETIDFMVNLGLDYMQCYCAVPYPGTALGELARRKGRLRAERWSQYDFGGDSIMDTDAMSCEEVTAFRREAFRRFYLRPGYLAKTILRTCSPWRLLRVAAFGGWMGLTRKRKKAGHGE